MISTLLVFLLVFEFRCLIRFFSVPFFCRSVNLMLSLFYADCIVIICLISSQLERLFLKKKKKNPMAVVEFIRKRFFCLGVNFLYCLSRHVNLNNSGTSAV